jgi:hypothetical protein
MYICINNDGSKKYLTIGRTYKPLGKKGGLTAIINDDGNKVEYFIERFIELRVKLYLDLCS